MTGLEKVFGGVMGRKLAQIKPICTPRVGSPDFSISVLCGSKNFVKLETLWIKC